jgi:hypothetical protein
MCPTVSVPLAPENIVVVDGGDAADDDDDDDDDDGDDDDDDDDDDGDDDDEEDDGSCAMEATVDDATVASDDDVTATPSGAAAAGDDNDDDDDDVGVTFSGTPFRFGSTNLPCFSTRRVFNNLRQAKMLRKSTKLTVLHFDLSATTMIRCTCCRLTFCARTNSMARCSRFVSSS